MFKCILIVVDGLERSQHAYGSEDWRITSPLTCNPLSDIHGSMRAVTEHRLWDLWRRERGSSSGGARKAFRSRLAPLTFVVAASSCYAMTATALERFEHGADQAQQR